MPRVVKSPDVRRDELLDIAQQLIAEVGYEAMSVEAVTQAAGVAKGTFYHYFASKEDMLGQLLQRLMDGLFAHVSAQAAAAQGGAIQRLAAILQASSEYKTLRLPSYLSSASLYLPENYSLRHRLFEGWARTVREIVAPVVADGVAEGSFHVGAVEFAADVLVSLWFDTAQRILERAVREPDVAGFVTVLDRDTTALWAAQERLLGVPAGSFTVPLPANAETLFEPIYSELLEVMK
jgi:Transcriptional regulator